MGSQARLNGVDFFGRLSACRISKQKKNAIAASEKRQLRHLGMISVPQDCRFFNSPPE